MNFYIVAFRSRTDSLKFYDYLKKNGFMAEIINTPRDTSIGCGISVRFNASDYDRVRNIYNSFQYMSSFIGFYKLIKSGVKTIAIPL